MLLLYFPSSQYCANALHRVRVYGLALNTCFGGRKHCWKCSKVSLKKKPSYVTSKTDGDGKQPALDAT